MKDFLRQLVREAREMEHPLGYFALGLFLLVSPAVLLPFVPLYLLGRITVWAVERWLREGP